MTVKTRLENLTQKTTDLDFYTSSFQTVTPQVIPLAKTAIIDTKLLDDIDNEFYPCYTEESKDGEHLIEFAGRTCYQSFHNPAQRTTEGYIKNIVGMKHFSVLEHANITFFIEGVSRAFTHELIRHRHHSYSQLSQRYVDSKRARYVCPPLFRTDAQLASQWESSCRRVQKELFQLEHETFFRHPDLSKKQVREAVRSIAPNCLETKIVVTGNLRAWRELLEKRWNSHAEAEIAEVAGMFYDHLNEFYPSVFADIAYSE